MRNEIVLVTGASSGIGEAVARHLAANRYTVVLTARRREKLIALEKEMIDKGQRAVAIPGDLCDEKEARAVVAEALKTFGTVHALVHSAGLFHMGPVQETSAERFRAVMDTNLTSLFFLVKHLLPHLQRQAHGHVVALSSIMGKQVFAGETAYCASKWGLMGFLGALREEVRAHNIQVTALCPGAVRTPSWDSFPGPIPEDRILAPETVAEAVRYILEQPAAACVDELVLTPTRGPIEM